MSVTHLAGIDVEANGFLRQRCAWCGALLLEYELRRVARALEPGEDPANPKPWRPATWPVHAFVEVDDHLDAGGFRSGAVVDAGTHADSERIKIPDGACLLLDTAVTT